MRIQHPLSIFYTCCYKQSEWSPGNRSSIQIKVKKVRWSRFKSKHKRFLGAMGVWVLWEHGICSRYVSISVWIWLEVTLYNTQQMKNFLPWRFNEDDNIILWEDRCQYLILYGASINWTIIMTMKQIVVGIECNIILLIKINSKYP